MHVQHLLCAACLPSNNSDLTCQAQNLYSFLGKIIKIRLYTAPGATGYGVPPGNPFAGEFKSKWGLTVFNGFSCTTLHPVRASYCSVSLIIISYIHIYKHTVHTGAKHSVACLCTRTDATSAATAAAAATTTAVAAM
jgi:hypothetical protein